MHAPRGNVCILDSSPVYTIPTTYAEARTLGPIIQAVLHVRDMALETAALLDGPDEYVGTEFASEIITFTMDSTKHGDAAAKRRKQTAKVEPPVSRQVQQEVPVTQEVPINQAASVPQEIQAPALAES